MPGRPKGEPLADRHVAKPTASHAKRDSFALKVKLEACIDDERQFKTANRLVTPPF